MDSRVEGVIVHAHTLSTVIAVPPTPFDAAGTLDITGLERVLARLVEGGITTITVNGNTGEFTALAPSEALTVARAAGEMVGDRTSLIVGTGGDLATAAQVARAAADAGAWGVMVHEPFGPFRSEAGWTAYLESIANAVPDTAVVPYVRDTRVTGVDLARLAERCRNVVAVKYAVPDTDRFQRVLVEAATSGLTWICGLAELWAQPFWSVGATGFTSGLATVAPALSLRLLERLRAGDWEGARTTNERVRPFEELRARRQGAANIPAVKEALAQLGVAGRAVRPPISELSQDERAEVTDILASWTMPSLETAAA
jgi:4-hydroxy-tetrahydrodipicolinate synthase